MRVGGNTVYIVTAQEMYDIDNYTMKNVGHSGKISMENASRSVCARGETSYK